MKIDFSNIGPTQETRPWIVINPGIPRPEWWCKVNYTLKVIYYNKGPEGVAEVDIQDYLL